MPVLWVIVGCVGSNPHFRGQSSGLEAPSQQLPDPWAARDLLQLWEPACGPRPRGDRLIVLETGCVGDLCLSDPLAEFISELGTPTRVDCEIYTDEGCQTVWEKQGIVVYTRGEHNPESVARAITLKKSGFSTATGAGPGRPVSCLAGMEASPQIEVLGSTDGGPCTRVKYGVSPALIFLDNRGEPIGCDGVLDRVLVTGWGGE